MFHLYFIFQVKNIERTLTPRVKHAVGSIKSETQSMGRVNQDVKEDVVKIKNADLSSTRLPIGVSSLNRVRNFVGPSQSGQHSQRQVNIFSAIFII